MLQQKLLRIQQLYAQNRLAEAEKELLDILEQNPDFEHGQYLLASLYLEQGKKDKCKPIVQHLCNAHPEELPYIALMAELALANENYEKAEDAARHLIKSDAEDDSRHFLLAKIYFTQRFYDKALSACNTALSLNPDNLGALNMRLSINSQMGYVDEARINVIETLQRDPENPHSIANHGLSLLNEGRVDEALEKFKDALSRNPNSPIARMGMTEGLKSKFWPYKMFYQFGLKMSRLSGKNMWMVIIGAYLLFRLIRVVSESNEALKPFLTPIIYVIVVLFLSTWFLDPLMNLYLLNNKYGKLLLDEESKKSATLTGI